MSTDNMFYGATAQTFEKAKTLRKDMTEAEKRLWEHMSKKQLLGFKFRRQHPIGDFIVDFYCHSLKLAIEIDGGYHEEQGQKEYDKGRTQEINKLGITIMRFKNEEILNEIGQVLDKIKTSIDKQKVSPSGEI